MDSEHLSNCQLPNGSLFVCFLRYTYTSIFGIYRLFLVGPSSSTSFKRLWLKFHSCDSVSICNLFRYSVMHLCTHLWCLKYTDWSSRITFLASIPKQSFQPLNAVHLSTECVLSLLTTLEASLLFPSVAHNRKYVGRKNRGFSYGIRINYLNSTYYSI